jgi:hypothetical protein
MSTLLGPEETGLCTHSSVGSTARGLRLGQGLSTADAVAGPCAVRILRTAQWTRASSSEDRQHFSAAL